MSSLLKRYLKLLKNPYSSISDFVSINRGSYFQTRPANGTFDEVDIPLPRHPIEFGDLTPQLEHLSKTCDNGVCFELNTPLTKPLIDFKDKTWVNNVDYFSQANDGNNTYDSFESGSNRINYPAKNNPSLY